MTATIAIFLDSYRELCAKRLFWFVLGITALVVGVFAFVDINESGLVILAWELDAPFNTTLLSRETFFKMIFVYLGVGMWLTWAATILALISTAGIIPDFLAGGAIELTLSKPISRVRLFLTKFATGLLFVTLQVLVFSTGAFLIIGLKGGAWEPRLFLAVPIVLAFFSYLFCLCALFGLMTRSTIASLLLTLLCWLLVSLLGSAETMIATVSLASEKQAEALQSEIDARQARIQAIREGQQTDGVFSAVASQMSLPEQERRLEEARERLEDRGDSTQTWQRWHTALLVAKSVLPKTTETIGLLERALLPPDELASMTSGEMQEHEEKTRRRRDPDDPDAAPRIQFDHPEVRQEVEQEIRDRSVWWVLGTSLAFEGVILLLACVSFSRKDF